MAGCCVGCNGLSVLKHGDCLDWPKNKLVLASQAVTGFQSEVRVNGPVTSENAETSTSPIWSKHTDCSRGSKAVSDVRATDEPNSCHGGYMSVTITRFGTQLY